MTDQFYAGYAENLSGVWGRKFRFMDELDSTNTFLLENGVIPGEVVSCMHQKAGRGRSGRVWESEPGDCLMFSIMLPDIGAGRLAAAQIVAGYALVDALLSYADIRLKWPNDIMCAGKKLGGILIETRFSGNSLSKAVLGIGINFGSVPENIAGKAGALTDFCDELPTAGMLLAAAVNSLEEKFAEYLSGGLDIADEWPLYSANYKKSITFHRNGDIYKAYEQGITSDGFLIVKNFDGTVYNVSAGEIGYDFSV